MGMVLGKISVETPKYTVIESKDDYEIRKYPPSVIAQVTYDPSQFEGNNKNKEDTRFLVKSKDAGFTLLAKYIGAFGSPQNTRPEKIAMTAPVITKTAPTAAEKIAMTAPVVTKSSGDDKKIVTMQFLLPSKYQKAEDAPKPSDERVVIVEEGERKYGVVRFGGIATDEVVAEKVEKLKKNLERDGHKVIGDHVLARYNPPWTLPMFRTNDVMIPVE